MGQGGSGDISRGRPSVDLPHDEWNEEEYASHRLIEDQSDAGIGIVELFIYGSVGHPADHGTDHEQVAEEPG